MRAWTYFLAVGLSAGVAGCRSGGAGAVLGGIEGLAVSGRRFDGREIALSDRSKWAVQAAGASATLGWAVGEPVRVGGSGLGAWPVAITSQRSGATALARPAGRY